MFCMVTLIGYVGKDPEVRSTQSGQIRGTFSVATTERVPDGKGGWMDRTEWHRVVVWSKTAEAVGRYVKKGSKVFVEGRLRSSEWTDRDGAKRRTFEVHADVIKFLDPNPNARLKSETTPDDDPAPGGYGHGGGESRAPQHDDDIPF